MPPRLQAEQPVAERLRRALQEALLALGNGLLRHPANGRLRDDLTTGSLGERDYHRQLLRLTFRLAFLLLAEARGLLPDPSAERKARERYRAELGLPRLLAPRSMAGWPPQSGPGQDGPWRRLVQLLGLLGPARPELGLPALECLFATDSAAALPWLSEVGLDDSVLLAALWALHGCGPGPDPAGHPGCPPAGARGWTCRVERNAPGRVEPGAGGPLPWATLGVDELGAAYASLLEQHPLVDAERGLLTLQTAAGHARKTTGSYYTPAPLVEVLLDEALSPVLDEAARQPEPQRAILGLRICDPACGSGHLLVAAARRIAGRLVAASSCDGTGEPDGARLRPVQRAVLAHCIHGVDLDPLAVELCRLNLWLDAVEPGLPLPTCAGEIRCGNSLLGATPALLQRGVPDAAFRALPGDDPAAATQLRRRNREERKVRGAGARRPAEEPTPAVQDRRLARLLADGWVAAFVWPKTTAAGLQTAPTDGLWRRWAAGTEVVPIPVRRTVEHLATQYGFFHWHLEFPAVFRPADRGEQPAEGPAGCAGGFDCVLGNPPWERLKFQEKEWIAQRRPAVARAKSAAHRKQRLSELGAAEPELLAACHRARRVAQGAIALLRFSGRYPLCSRGDVNSYALFAELACSLLSASGRAGLIVPTGIATGETTGPFFRELLGRRRLVSIYDFMNRDGFFPGVTTLQRFCLLTMAGQPLPPPARARCLFGARRLAELGDARRVFTIDAGDVALVNPFSGTCPAYAGKEDAAIARKIYRRVPPLGRGGLLAGSEADRGGGGSGGGGGGGGGGSGGGDRWQFSFQRLLDMTNDAGHLRLVKRGEKVDPEQYLPVYEGKMVAMFDHRAASIEFRADNELRQQQPVLHAAATHLDPSFRNRAYLHAPTGLVLARLGCAAPLPWFLVFKRVTSAANMRTLVSCIVPWAAPSYTLYIVRLPAWQQHLAPALLANLSSFVVDWRVRQKATQPSLPMGVMYETAILPPAAFAAPAPWDHGTSVGDWLKQRVLELCYTSWDLQGFARDCGWSGPPFRWDEQRRFLLRGELDAACFFLYGLEREEAAHVLDGFAGIRRKEQAGGGEFRTRRQILEIYDLLRQAAGGGNGRGPAAPYRSLLDPPPADPAAAHR